MKFVLNDISVHRSLLMGYAIIWIMMLHFTFTQIKPIGFIAQYGFAGVDIFMMMSGLGLYFSLEKDNNICHFYKKRFLRIFPTYYFLGIFSSIFIHQDNFQTYLFRYSTIGFWTGGVFGEWYIPSIVFLYIFAPFIKKIFDKRHLSLILFINIVILIAAYVIVVKELLPKYDPHFFFLYRIPAFIFGMTCAYWIKNDISSKYYRYLFIAGIPIFIMLFPKHHYTYNYKYLSLLFLLPAFTIIFLYVSKLIHWINPIIAKLGNASLEIYLIQGIFSTAILDNILILPDNLHDILAILLIITSSVLGITIHWLIGKSNINRLI